jgi:hypothetical protein
MCGIVGVLQYESPVSREVRQKALKILFTDTMEKTESRGEDATGIYQVHRKWPDRDFGDWAMSKKGVKVSEWLFLDNEDSKDPVVYNDFINSWLEHPQELTALIGHCRKATVGSRGSDNDDNHPFTVQLDKDNAILGIHNGTLANHEIIFRKLPKMLKRQGTVDSEAIFHLMFHLSEHGTKPWDEKMLVKLGQRLDGAAACVVVNTRFPNIVATWRFGRPLEYILIAPLNIVLVCSDKKFAEAALDKYEFIRKMFDTSLPSLDIHDSGLTERDFRIFDTSKPWPEGKPGFQDLAKISIRGDMKPYTKPLEEGWFIPKTEDKKKPTTTSGYTAPAGCGENYSGTGRTQGAGVKTTKVAAHSPGKSAGTKALGPGTASKEDAEETGVVVEIEVPTSEERATKAFEHAKSMGVCTHFGSQRDLSTNIGCSLLELGKLTPLELANLVAKNHFNLGYAVANFDAKAELDGTRRKGRDLIARLEAITKKKSRAEGRIWELKQLVTIMLGLVDSGYPINKENVDITLTSFSELSEDRRCDILLLADDILKDKSVKKVVEGLRKRFEEAKTRRTGTKTTTAKG